MSQNDQRAEQEDADTSKSLREGQPTPSAVLPNETIAPTEPESPHDTVRRLMREAQERRNRTKKPERG